MSVLWARVGLTLPLLGLWGVVWVCWGLGGGGAFARVWGGGSALLGLC